MGWYVVGLGSNLGGRLRNILAALEILSGYTGIEKVSRVYLTEPLGPPQGWFLNMSVFCVTDIPPLEMLDLCKGIESELGRATGPRWGPRVVDLDLLLWSGGCYYHKLLQIPHPRWCERLFVVRTLLDLGIDEVEGVSLKGVAGGLSNQRVIPLPCASKWVETKLLRRVEDFA